MPFEVGDYVEHLPSGAIGYLISSVNKPYPADYVLLLPDNRDSEATWVDKRDLTLDIHWWMM